MSYNCNSRPLTDSLEWLDLVKNVQRYGEIIPENVKFFRVALGHLLWLLIRAVLLILTVIQWLAVICIVVHARVVIYLLIEIQRSAFIQLRICVEHWFGSLVGKPHVLCAHYDYIVLSVVGIDYQFGLVLFIFCFPFFLIFALFLPHFIVIS